MSALLLGGLAVACDASGASDSGVVWLRILVLATVVWCALTLRTAHLTLAHPYTIFLASCIVFNAGQFLLEAVRLPFSNPISAGFSDTTIGATLKTVIVGLLALQCGALFARRRRPPQLAPWKPSPGSTRWAAVSGAAMAAVSIGPWAWAASTRIQRVSEFGYSMGQFGISTPTGMLRAPWILADLFPAALLFLLCGIPGCGKTYRTLVQVLVAVYVVASVASGSRGPALSVLAAAFWLRYRLGGRRPTLIHIVAITLPLMVVTPVISAAREAWLQKGGSLAHLRQHFAEIENPAIEGLAEMGWSASTVAHTIELVPGSRNYAYGMTYANALLSVLPNVFGDIHPAKESLAADWLVRTIEPQFAARGGGWGFSFIAEAFLNFGPFFPVALLAIGYLAYSALSWADATCDAGRIAAVACVLLHILLYARGESIPLVHDAAWYALLPYLLYRFSARHFHRTNRGVGRDYRFAGLIRRPLAPTQDARI